MPLDSQLSRADIVPYVVPRVGKERKRFELSISPELVGVVVEVRVPLVLTCNSEMTMMSSR